MIELATQMNYWVEKSIEFANSPGYLDRLTAVYPAIPTERPPLPQYVRDKVKQLFDEEAYTELIKLLVSFKGYPFPLEHPYIPLLREKPQFADLNPVVIEKIARILESLGYEGIIRGCERPPDLNRQMGPRFKNWLRSYFPSKGYAFLNEYSFEGYKGKAFLKAGDAAITRYANQHLGCKITRGRDLLAKVGDEFVIGEARFLSSWGGSQSRDVRETVNFAKDAVGDVIQVAILDGMPWFDSGMLNVLRTLGDDEPGMSALLLEEFLDSLG